MDASGQGGVRHVKNDVFWNFMPFDATFGCRLKNLQPMEELLIGFSFNDKNHFLSEFGIRESGGKKPLR